MGEGAINFKKRCFIYIAAAPMAGTCCFNIANQKSYSKHIVISLLHLYGRPLPFTKTFF